MSCGRSTVSSASTNSRFGLAIQFISSVLQPVICQSGSGSPAGAFARCQLSFTLPCSERHSPDFIIARASKPPFASYRRGSPSGCTPSMMYTFAWSNHETASSNGRHRSTFATSFVPFSTGQVRDSSATPVAVIAGAGPISDTLTELANTTSDSVPGPGRPKLSRPLESALIFGLNFKYVSSAVTSALMTAASSRVAGTFPRVTGAFVRATARFCHRSIFFQAGKTKASSRSRRKSAG